MNEAERFLPQELLSRASKRGNELAWRWKDLLSVAYAAEQAGLASAGGQAQFRSPDGTFEINWSSFTSGGRIGDETPEQYVIRSWKETRRTCYRLFTDESAIAEGKSIFRFIRETVKQDILPRETIWFILYFQSSESGREIHGSGEEPAPSSPKVEPLRRRKGRMVKFMDGILGLLPGRTDDTSKK
jgi:hypothetical protein